MPPDGELAFLRPLPVQRLWGVGPATAAKLHDRGLTIVAEVAALGEAALVSLLGRAAGRQVHALALAHNRDPRPVRPRRGRRSFGAQSALGRSSTSPESIDALAIALVERVTRRMRRAGRAGRTVTLRLRFGDYARATRSHTLSEPTAATKTVLATTRSLLAAASGTIERRGLTLIGVTVATSTSASPASSRWRSSAPMAPRSTAFATASAPRL